MVVEIKKISVITLIAFLFALPMVLSNFIYVGISAPYWILYYFLYLALCACVILVSIILFFIWLFADKENIGWILAANAAALAVLVIMFSLQIIILKSHDEGDFNIGANYNKFNSVKWQRADFYNGNRREYMLKDLTKNVLPGKNIEEITDLLGEPYAIVNEGKTYYSYPADNGDTTFRRSIKDENGKHISYEIIDKKDLYQSVKIKGNMIYYITGPAFMDHSTLDIYFDENGIFNEYKYLTGST